ncbi:MAG TPA: hypothetical protein VFY45_12985 [Baekduia sp.]|nr:hypothetical protein [Baekduia sp.]
MFKELQHTIAAALSDGSELDAIEQQIINRAPLDEEQKSALWLYAAALTQRPARRPLADAIFGELGDWSVHD